MYAAPRRSPSLTPFVLAAFSVAAPVLLAWWVGRRPYGTLQDPYPYDPNGAPPQTRYVAAGATPIRTRDIAVLVRRRWESTRGPLPPEGLAILLAHVAVTTDGSVVANWNLILRNADPAWPGLWTTVREAVWARGRKVWRWTPIRAYASLSAAVADWIDNLPRDAVAGVAIGSAGAYARAMVRAGAVDLDPTYFATMLTERTRKSASRRLLASTWRANGVHASR